jgi:hypothetical protein
MPSPSLKLVGNTSTAFRTPPTTKALGTQSDAHSPEDVLGSSPPRRSGDVNEVWREIAVYQQHVTALSRVSATFYASLNIWKQETEFFSSLTDILLHPAYQRIIGLGPEVVPFILRELADHGGHWSWALKALTGADPVAPENEGRTRAMSAAWLQWGQSRGLI